MEPFGVKLCNLVETTEDLIASRFYAIDLDLHWRTPYICPFIGPSTITNFIRYLLIYSVFFSRSFPLHRELINGSLVICVHVRLPSRVTHELASHSHPRVALGTSVKIKSGVTGVRTRRYDESCLYMLLDTFASIRMFFSSWSGG